MHKDETSSTQTPLKLGQLVVSIAGRDKGDYYLVYDFDGKFYLLVDGKKRGLNNPKKKNRRHLQLNGKVAADFAKKIDAKEKIRNEDIRIYIAGLIESPKGE